MKKNVSILLLMLHFSLLYAQKEYTAYIFMAEECPVCNYLGKSLEKLSVEYKEEVQFVAVFPQRVSNIKTATLFKKKYGLNNFKIIIDKNRKVTNTYNATVTPEVVLVNKQDQTIYQGRIDDSYAAPGRMRHGKVTQELRDAIKNTIMGKKIKKPWPKPIGCYITTR